MLRALIAANVEFIALNRKAIIAATASPTCANPTALSTTAHIPTRST